MKKILFYAMTGEKSCLLHVLMNAVDLHAKGHEVKVIFEGRSVAMAPQLAEENNPHFVKAKENGLLAGICLACAKMLNVFEAAEATGLPMLNDMFGHAGMAPYVAEGYDVISM